MFEVVNSKGLGGGVEREREESERGESVHYQCYGAGSCCGCQVVNMLRDEKIDAARFTCNRVKRFVHSTKVRV